MKKAILIILLIVFDINLNGQNIIMEKDVAADTLPSKSGPNLKHYTHMYSAFGIFNGPTEGAGGDIIYGNSTDFNMGIRHKRKVLSFYDIGFDFYYGLSSFKLKQEPGKLLPTSDIHNKEKINFNHFGLSLFNRLNIGKRGNSIKNFIDFGAYGDLEFVKKHIFHIKHTTTNYYGGTVTKVVNRGLGYTNDINYGLHARVGRNRYSLFGKYRLSDLFYSSYSFPELPRLVVGLQVGLHM